MGGGKEEKGGEKGGGKEGFRQFIVGGRDFRRRYCQNRARRLRKCSIRGGGRARCRNMLRPLSNMQIGRWPVAGATGLVVLSGGGQRITAGFPLRSMNFVRCCAQRPARKINFGTGFIFNDGKQVQCGRYRESVQTFADRYVVNSSNNAWS